MTNRDTSQWVLEADEFDTDAEMMSEEEDAEMLRALQANVQHSEAYHSGKAPVRVTQLIGDEYVTFWTFADGHAADRYPIFIERGHETMGFVARIPDLPGCMAQGYTQAEALANVRSEVTAWFDAAIREGREIPTPRNRLAAA